MQNSKCKIQNAKCRTDAAEREQRVLAHYAEPRGGKALEEGLIQNSKLSLFTLFILFCGLLHRTHILRLAEVETYTEIYIR